MGIRTRRPVSTIMTYVLSEISINRSFPDLGSSNSLVALASGSKSGFSISSESVSDDSLSESLGGGIGFLNSDVGGKSNVIATARGKPPWVVELHSDSHVIPSEK